MTEKEINYCADCRHCRQIMIKDFNGYCIDCSKEPCLIANPIIYCRRKKLKRKIKDSKLQK